MLSVSRLFVPLFCLSAVLSAAEVSPLDLSSGANSHFRDEVDGDRKGGWTDQGSNDLRVLPAGDLKAGGIPFRILADSVDRKSCIVLGGNGERSYFPKRATLRPEKPFSGKFLYLLHAGAWIPKAKTHAGNLKIVYADGSSEEKHLRAGRDLADWWSSDSISNAVRVWSKYNNNSQVSLFASRFPLKNKPVQALVFESLKGVWMIASASVGDALDPVAIRKERGIHGTYKAPPRYPDETLSALQSVGGTPKNIILIIGDGMGLNAVRSASLHAHGKPGMLVMEQMPVTGLAKTFSANSKVTDSAASGTALSSGYKTNNGMVGMNPGKKAMRSIASEALSSGRSVGILTTDSLTGATPAAFYAHVPSRGQGMVIAAQAAVSGFDVLIGSSPSNFLPSAEKGKRTDGRNIFAEMRRNGYGEVSDASGIRENKEKKVFGTFRFRNETALSEAAAAMFDRLGKNPNGFFCMIESSYPDGGGHGNNPDMTVRGTLMVDHTLKAAVDYALKHKNTLIVVTADHETGGLFAAPNRKSFARPYMVYTTTSHTGSPVGVYAVGPGSDLFHGISDNTDIPKRFAGLWKLTLFQDVAR